MTLDKDYCEYMRKCHKCQIHANLMHTPLSQLYSMTTPWLFSIWGIDIIGEIFLKASNGHRYIIVAIDYFTKWVEATSYATLKAKDVVNFIQKNITYRYVVLYDFISDHNSHFQG